MCRKKRENYIVGRFSTKGKTISDYFAGKICDAVDGYSSYVQQLAWDVMQENAPDIDSDFESAKRGDVIKHVEEKYILRKKL